MCFSKWQLLLSLPTGRCFKGTVTPCSPLAMLLWVGKGSGTRAHIASKDNGLLPIRSANTGNKWLKVGTSGLWLKALNFEALERDFAASFSFSFNPVWQTSMGLKFRAECYLQQVGTHHLFAMLAQCLHCEWTRRLGHTHSAPMGVASWVYLNTQSADPLRSYFFSLWHHLIHPGRGTGFCRR